MNIYEAASSGRPFFHPQMIGAYMIIDDVLIHRDNMSDFNDLDWIRANCLCMTRRNDLFGMTPDDLLRNDWQIQEDA